MRIGVRVHDLGKLPAQDLAKRVREYGLSCVQLTLHEAIAGFDGGPGRLNPGLGFEVGEAFRSRGVQIAVLSCYINPIHPVQAERDRQVALFKEYVRFARDFGCSVVASETGSVNTDFSFNPENHSEGSFQIMLQSVGAMVQEAERFGVIVGIEGVASFVACDPQRIRRMLDSIGSNNLQVVFDPVNLLNAENHERRGDLIDESLQLFGDRIVALHAKDYVVEAGRLRSVTLGDGLLGYPRLLGQLSPRKPCLPVIIEDTGPRTIRRSAGHLRGVLKGL